MRCVFVRGDLFPRKLSDKLAGIFPSCFVMMASASGAGNSVHSPPSSTTSSPWVFVEDPCLPRAENNCLSELSHHLVPLSQGEREKPYDKVEGKETDYDGEYF